MPELENHPLLAFRGVSKSFPGVRALDQVDFTLQRGQIHALMGENGAGKSTLIKVLTGVHGGDSGEIRLEGRPIQPRSPREAQAFGISTVYQEVNLIPTLSVAENLFLGRQPGRWGMVGWRKINAAAARAINRLDLELDVTRPLGSFSIGIQQMVAIARAVDTSARVLVLDEPTSSLAREEVQSLFHIMRRLKSDGLGILFVTHFLEQVYEISDAITVLRNGRRVGEFETSKLPRLELVSHMVGRQISEFLSTGKTRAVSPETGPAQPSPSSSPLPSTQPGSTRVLLRARGLGRAGAIEPFDLEVERGELLGLAGLLGSGRTELVRLLFGLDRPSTGTIDMEGRPADIRHPRRAIALGIAFCPEDRKLEGILPDLSVRENIILALQGQRGWWRRLSREKQETLAEEFIRTLQIATSDADKPVKLLSGGNQQKVILGRWLATRPRLLILDEPTRGIDVGAKFEIARLMSDLCREGMAIIFVSSELEEVVRSSDRIVVLRDRKKIAELRGDEITEETVLKTIAQ